MIDWVDPQVQSAVVTAVSVIISGLLGISISNYYNRRSSSDEWQRRSLEWRRDQVLTFYSNSLYYLAKLTMSAASKQRDDKEVRQHVAESQRYLNLLEIYNEGNAVALQSARKMIEHAFDSLSSRPELLSQAADDALREVKKMAKVPK